MEFFEDLPPGLWLVKWIDRFHFKIRPRATALDIAFQKLPFDNPTAISSLKPNEVAELLGTRPQRPGVQEQAKSEIIMRDFLAGYLPEIHCGYVFSNEGLRGRLAAQSDQITIDALMQVHHLTFGSIITPPNKWTFEDKPFQVLNRFEYNLDRIRGGLQSRCVVFKYRDTQYVLPKIVIFRAFYTLSYMLTRALTPGPWSRTAKAVISFRKYESGIETSHDLQTNTWKIVLNTGQSRDHAYPLALYWFDEYARKQLESMYTDSLQQKRRNRPSEPMSWYANANIPHRFEPRPFQMQVEGYALRPLRPGFSDNDKRFLITAITGSSWSIPDQKLEVELHNSNQKSEGEPTQVRDRVYGFGMKPVKGGPNATATSDEPPDIGLPINEFTTKPFTYFELPPAPRQKKHSHKSYPPAPPAPSSGASDVVSVGDPTYGETVAAQANIEARILRTTRQFDLLIAALEKLKGTKDIDGFHALSPPETSDLFQLRSGLGCWSLLNIFDRRNKRVPARAWEVIYEEISEPMRAETKTRHPRCVLALAIQKAEKELYLLEIEPRSSESAFCMIAIEPSLPLLPGYMVPVLDTIRESRGVLGRSELDDILAILGSDRIELMRHNYLHEASKQKDILGPIIGLRHELFFQKLNAFLEGSDIIS